MIQRYFNDPNCREAKLVTQSYWDDLIISKGYGEAVNTYNAYFSRSSSHGLLSTQPIEAAFKRACDKHHASESDRRSKREEKLVSAAEGANKLASDANDLSASAKVLSKISIFISIIACGIAALSFILE